MKMGFSALLATLYRYSYCIFACRGPAKRLNSLPFGDKIRLHAVCAPNLRVWHLYPRQPFISRCRYPQVSAAVFSWCSTRRKVQRLFRQPLAPRQLWAKVARCIGFLVSQSSAAMPTKNSPRLAMECLLAGMIALQSRLSRAAAAIVLRSGFVPRSMPSPAQQFGLICRALQNTHLTQCSGGADF